MSDGLKEAITVHIALNVSPVNDSTSLGSVLDFHGFLHFYSSSVKWAFQVILRITCVKRHFEGIPLLRIVLVLGPKYTRHKNIKGRMRKCCINSSQHFALLLQGVDLDTSKYELYREPKKGSKVRFTVIEFEQIWISYFVQSLYFLDVYKSIYVVLDESRYKWNACLVNVH